MARRPGEIFPSDDKRRKNKPAVRVHHSLRNHPRYAGVAADPTLRGELVGLWMVASERHASKTGNVVTLTGSDLIWITGAPNAGAASLAYRRLCRTMGYTTRQEGTAGGTVYHTEIRNFSRKQGFDPAHNWGESGRIAGTPDPSDSESDSGVKKESKTPPAPSAKFGGEPPNERESVSKAKGGEMARAGDVLPSILGRVQPADEAAALGNSNGLHATPDFVKTLWQRRLPANPVARDDEGGEVFEQNLRGRIVEYPDKAQWLRLVVDQLPRQPYLLRGNHEHQPISLAKLVSSSKLFKRALEAQYQPEP